MRRHFSAVYVHGIDELAVLRPVILYANHSAWWDSLVAFDLSHRALQRDGYAMMDEHSFKNVPFLRWIGGFGVRIGDKEDGRRALRYAAELLEQPRIVLIFPQGRETPHSQRPLAFKPGLQRLQEQSGAAALPMAIRYEHGRDEKPFILISIGAPALDFEAAMLARLAFIEAALHDGSYRAWHAHLPPRKPKWVGVSV